MADNALVPLEQKQVVFYDDEITAVLVQLEGEEKIYVPVRPICEFLGVSWTGQLRRINRDAVLSEEIRSVNVTFTEPNRTRHIAMHCLPLDYISGFLFGINPERTKPEIKDKLIRYQRECFKVLAEAFAEGRLTADVSFDDLLQQASSDVVEAYQIAQAIMKLARNQIMLETRLDDHGRTLADYGRRLETIEADMHQEDRYISESQATQISQAVKTIAIALGKQTGQNEFGATWGEFYRKFGVAKYRYLPVSRFEEAMAWLNEFYQSLTGESPF
ncbi:MAG: ORF6C domain-containing protein [Anaerolineales bacterium]|nr:ORF6C domain-containing protein [Anaerolineales bacterium]